MMQMVYSVTHDINPTKAFFTVQNALRKSKVLDDITCTTLYRIKKKVIQCAKYEQKLRCIS